MRGLVMSMHRRGSDERADEPSVVVGKRGMLTARLVRYTPLGQAVRKASCAVLGVSDGDELEGSVDVIEERVTIA